MTRPETSESPRTFSEDDPGYYEALGRAIKVARTQRDVGRRALAERAGVSYAYLADIETGRGRPSSKALLAIAGALGLSPSELLQEAERYGALAAAPADPDGDRSTGRWFHSGEDRLASRMALAATTPPAAERPEPLSRTEPQSLARNRLALQSTDARAALHDAVDGLSDDDVNVVLALVRRLLGR